MPATYGVYIDWDADGDFSDPGENVTTRALDRTNITIQYGRDQARALSPIAPGRAELELDNISRDYSPENSASPLAGNLLPGRRIKIQATLSGATTVMLDGHLDDYEVLPDTNSRSVQLTAFDLLARFVGVKVTVDLQFSITTGRAIHLVLDALGWSATARDIDAGATVIRWYWEEQTDGLDALKRIAASEGPAAMAYVDYTTGNFVFRDRHHRLVRAASVTSQATLRGSGAEPVLARPLVYDQGWKNIINSVEFSVEERDPASELTDVFSSDRVYSIADGQTIPVQAGSSDPFYAAVTPEAGTDYTLVSGAVEVTMSRTSGQSTTVSIKAIGGPALVQGLRVRAYPVRVVRTFQVSAEDTASIGTPDRPKYGRRSYPGETPVWAGVDDAQAIADIVVAQRAEPLAAVRIRLISANDTRLAQQLGRRLSDRITIVDSETGLNAPFFIERVEQRVIQGGMFLETVFGCEKVPTQPANVFILGSATRGVLGTNRLGKDGLDDPANIFILGSATNGVLGTGLLGH